MILKRIVFNYHFPQPNIMGYIDASIEILYYIIPIPISPIKINNSIVVTDRLIIHGIKLFLFKT